MCMCMCPLNETECFQGVDETTSSMLVYSNGRVATLMFSIRCELPCEGVVVGTKGTLKVSIKI